jgi:hypothetical protein
VINKNASDRICKQFCVWMGFEISYAVRKKCDIEDR